MLSYKLDFSSEARFCQIQSHLSLWYICNLTLVCHSWRIFEYSNMILDIQMFVSKKINMHVDSLQTGRCM